MSCLAMGRSTSFRFSAFCAQRTCVQGGVLQRRRVWGFQGEGPKSAPPACSGEDQLGTARSVQLGQHLAARRWKAHIRIAKIAPRCMVAELNPTAAGRRCRFRPFTVGSPPLPPLPPAEHGARAAHRSGEPSRAGASANGQTRHALSIGLLGAPTAPSLIENHPAPQRRH